MAAKANADTSVAANNTNYTAPLVALFDLECTRLHLPIVLLIEENISYEPEAESGLTER